MNRVKIFNHLSNNYSLEEVLEICFQFNIDHENLPGTTKTGKVRELILYLERRNRLGELRNLLLSRQENNPEKSAYQKTTPSFSTETLDLLQQHIRKDKLEKALDSLLAASKNNTSLHENLINLSAQLARGKEDHQLGSLSYDDWQVLRTKVRRHLLEILKSITT